MGWATDARPSDSSTVDRATIGASGDHGTGGQDRAVGEAHAGHGVVLHDHLGHRARSRR